MTRTQNLNWNIFVIFETSSWEILCPEGPYKYQPAPKNILKNVIENHSAAVIRDCRFLTALQSLIAAAMENHKVSILDESKSIHKTSCSHRNFRNVLHHSWSATKDPSNCPILDLPATRSQREIPTKNHPQVKIHQERKDLSLWLPILWKTSGKSYGKSHSHMENPMENRWFFLKIYQFEIFRSTIYQSRTGTDASLP